MRLGQLRDTSRLDRELTGREVKQQHPQSVDVRLHRRRRPGDHFRRQVERCARAPTGALHVRGRVSGAEVHQHVAAPGFPHHVLGFDVAMEKAGMMDRRHCPAEAGADDGGLLRTHRPATCHLRFERVAGDQLHPQANPSVDEVGTVNGCDVGMTHAREESCLAQEVLGVAGSRRALEELQRDFAVEPRVDGPVDLALRAFAKAFDEGEVAPSFEEGGRLQPNGHRPRSDVVATDVGPVDAPERRDDAEVVDDFELVVGARAGFCGCPVDGHAVGDGACQCRQRIVSGHSSSPWLVAAARA